MAETRMKAPKQEEGNKSIARITEHLQPFVSSGEIEVHPTYSRRAVRFGEGKKDYFFGTHTFTVGAKNGSFGVSSPEELVGRFLPQDLAESARLLGIRRGTDGETTEGSALARPAIFEFQVPATQYEKKNVRPKKTVPQIKDGKIRVIIGFYPTSMDALISHQELEVHELELLRPA